jgi:PAS domain S-box-containing protein
MPVAEAAEAGSQVHAGFLATWPGMALLASLVALVVLLVLSGRLRRKSLEVEASSRRLFQLFNNAPVGVIVKDMRPQVEWLEMKRRGGVTDMGAYLAAHPEELAAVFRGLVLVSINRTALELGGFRDVDEVRGELGNLAQDFMEVFQAELEALWVGRTELTQNATLRRRNGEVVQAILQWTVPMEGERRDYARVMSVVTDVTDLRRTQAQLRQSEERWELAVKGINAGIWEVDFATERFFVSERSRAMLGYAPGDLDDSRAAWEALVHPEDRLAVRSAMEQHLARKSDSYRVEHRFMCRDGQYRWVLSCGLAQFGRDGLPVRCVGTHSDIHSRKCAEEELAAERERLKVTLRAMVEAVITTDRHGVVNYLNEAAEALTGWTDGVAIGRLLADVAPLLHERTREPLPPPHKSALAEALVVELPPSTVIRHRQGVIRLVEGRCAPIRDFSSQPAGVVLVLRDMTERVKLEAEVLRATKLESVGVLAGGIAHDFNNLLTVVMGNVTLAMLDTQVNTAGVQWLHEAERGLMRARDLTQQLLTFAKGGDPVRSAVQLSEVVRETANFCLHGAKAKCQFEFENNLWAADVDKGQIGQVVQNLVMNAAQAMPQGGMIWVNLSNDASPPLRSGLVGATVRLSISDAGAGIRPEHVSKIFDPYFTTKSDGSGLGLATVYAIVKKHHGYIEVESEVGRGTRFRLWLPATRTATASPLSNAPFGGGAAAMNGRVLLMDDEEAIRMMASQLLMRIGFQVETAADGAIAVEVYRKALAEGRRFDLVITDLTVPGAMGGLDCMRELVRIDPKVRAIVSSGYSSDPVMSDHRAYGFAGMIPKPYRITDFAKTIRRVLEGVE